MLGLAEAYATVSVRTFTWLSCLNAHYCLRSCDLFALLAFAQIKKEILSDHLSSADMSTFQSFAGRMYREFPVLSGRRVINHSNSCKTYFRCHCLPVR